jgi:methionyl-tRNA formyltransferase
MVVAAYGLILPREVLDLPPLGCVNVHASLLPRWRGAAPIQRAILAGDTETGISIMQMAEGLDTGDVLLRETIPIGPEDTAAVLHDRLASLGARTLVQALAGVAEGRLTPEPQDDRAATYATKLSKQEAVLDWSSSAEQLARAVRAFNPWPVASAASPLGNLRIWRARAVATATEAAPGTVLAEGPEGIDVATGDGCLRIEVLQRPGGRPLESAAFLSGVSLAGERLGEGG